MKLAVIGKDVSQSLSPAMHRFILERLGETCSYEAVSVPPEEFSSRAEELFGKYGAFNVTIPFKADIIPFLTELRGDAATFGAVNTVLSRERAGYNTDGYGFLLMLKNAGLSVKGKSALVLGAGGAGRSCIKKLIDEGAEVFAFERDESRLRAVHDEFGGFTPLSSSTARESACTGRWGRRPKSGERTVLAALSGGSFCPFAARRWISSMCRRNRNFSALRKARGK